MTSRGLALSITGLTFTGTQATVAFTVTDPKGVGLDRAGLFTDGTVSVSFALAQLAQNPDGSPAQYTAYTTRVQTTPGGVSATQAAAESTGTIAVVDMTKGQYTYTFAADLSAHDAQLTQTVAGTATRTMFDGGQYLSDTFFSIGPTTTPAKRQVITEAACNKCHGDLAAHGSHWSSTEQCVLCHQPQSSDPDTGNTVDFRVMIHKIHRGENLPSVKLGGSYHIVGYAQTDVDFSDVGFPGALNKCDTCHATDALQPTTWQVASIETCTSCHDNTVFKNTEIVVGKTVIHTAGEEAPGSCPVCHGPGGIKPVKTLHYTGTLDDTKPQLALTIDSITNTGPNKVPVVAFTVTDHGVGRNLTTAPLTTLTATIAGPNTDFASYWQWKLVGGTGTLTTIDAAAGKYSYQFASDQVIPASAAGSYTLGLEANYTDPVTSVRYAPVSPVAAFAVTDPVAVARRTVIAPSNCNNCHGDLSGHGGGRRGAAYCVLCHQPNNVNDERVARFETPNTALAESVDMKVFIHKIHMGERLTEAYTLGGFPVPTPANPAGTPLDFTRTTYPRDQATCTACHTGTTYAVPMPAGVLPANVALMSCGETPSADTNNYCDAPWGISQLTPIAPEAAVCTSCHDAGYVAVHAALNTAPSGATACATCHGAGKTEDVAVVHHLN
ncbi:MAG: OmcA/MtrC family decaheme c-type cytochrome [Deltaproteobacteria bacterium]|nr:OmcA/MtrC family decaheme c-type cytochrome [Deltaproteobacteria bacterium]